VGVELDFLNFIQENLRTLIGDAVMPIITQTMNYDILAGVIAVILICTKRFRWVGVAILIGAALGYLIGNGMIKFLVDRPRPFIENSNIILLIPAPTSSSFPSGHTIGAVAMAVALYMYNKKAGYVGFIFAAIIAYSRLYLYLHYPTDVIAGIVIGIICGYVGYRISELIRIRYKKEKVEEDIV